MLLKSWAERAQKDLARLSSQKYWTSRYFSNLDEILHIDDFPEDEIYFIAKLTDLIDKKSANKNLFRMFLDKDAVEAERSNISETARVYFDNNETASEKYVELVYNGMMAISYVDNLYGEPVRPWIEEKLKNSNRKPREIIDNIHTSNFPIAALAAA
jgi:hypothetical protein